MADPSTNLSAARRTMRRVRRRRLAAGLEALESRRLLTVAWRNPVDSLDVDADSFIAPVDALTVINELNGIGSRALPATHDASQPFLDASGDQHVSPIDALLVINALNDGVANRRTLREGSGLADFADVTVTVGPAAGRREYRVRLDASFDTSGAAAAVADRVAVYVVAPGDSNATLLDRGTPGTSVFTLSEDDLEFAPGIARWDGNSLVVDLSGVVDRDTAVLRFQLLDGDADRGSQVTIAPESNEVTASAGPARSLVRANSLVAPAARVDPNAVTPRPEVEALVENVRFDAGAGVYSAELSLVNRGPAVGRDALVAFPGLPAGVTLAQAQGVFGTGAAPYLDLHDALPDGGLPRGGRSRAVPLTLLDPTGVPFSLTPIVAAADNHPPTFAPPPTLATRPGDALQFQLDAQDPDGDRLLYSIVAGPSDLAVELSADGAGVVRPSLEDVGTHEFRVVVSDGALQVERTLRVDVLADPLATTRVSGRILRVDGEPLVGMRVEIGAVQSLTTADGSFELDLGLLPPVTDTLRVRGELFNGPATYPFIAERLRLMLGKELVLGVDNVIDRPIFLPTLDVLNGAVIDPQIDVTVTTAALPGAAVFVRAGTLFNQQSTLFTGRLSITEVPVDRTPAVLPEGLVPDLVVTIQPGEMVFASPAPLALPNRAGLAPGTPLELWSINPSNGEFEIVGAGRVATDGTRIETVSGGIRNSSWHFFAPLLANANQANRLQDPNQNDRNQANSQACGDCPPYRVGVGESAVRVGSEVVLHSGRLTEDHQSPTYQSVGVDRGVRLTYDSLRADPRPIVHFAIDDAVGAPAGSTTVDLVVAKLFFERGETRQQVPGFEPGPDALGLALGGGEHFFRLPAGSNRVDLALQADLTAQPTGVYDFELTFGVQRFDGLTSRVGRTQEFARRETVVNKRFSPFGAGWDLAGLQELVENADGSVLWVSGGGGESVFDAPLTPGGPFISPAGDFGTLVRTVDGEYRYEDPFGTVTRFGANLQIASLTDRNGNRTSFEYDTAGVLERIVDPAGLVTTFASSLGKITTITDPAGRVTRLEHSGENLVAIVDPDGSRRQFEYDASRRMTAEIDRRGFREEEIYGFHGRVIATKDKEGFVRFFEPVQTQGLFPAEDTTRPNNPPVAAIAPLNEAVSTFTDANGRVVVTVLDAEGLELARADEVGALPVTVRNAAGLPIRTTDARGNVTETTYDAHGNVTSIVDEVARALTADQAIPPLFDSAVLGVAPARTDQVLAGDLDGDGDADAVLVATISATSVTPLMSGGDVSFAQGATTTITALRRGALADVDGDGDLDLILLRSGTGSLAAVQNISLLKNDGAGVFGAPQTFAIPGTNTAVLAVGDIDGDGSVDVLVANNGATRPLVVLFGDGAGGLGAPLEIGLSGLIGGAAVRDVAIGDMNGDGRADLTAFTNGGNLVTVGNLGGRTFAPPTQQSVAANLFQYTLVDVDADQDVDFVGRITSPTTGASQFAVALNLGLGQLATATTIATANMGTFRVGDVTGDGKPDLVSDSTFHVGAGNGTFATGVRYAPLGASLRDLALLDVDSDGRLDVFCELFQDFGESLATFLSGPGGPPAIPRFTFTGGAADLAVGDLDGDGDADVAAVASGGIANNVALLFNDGAGGLGNSRALSSVADLLAVTLGDADGDGDLDLLTAGAQGVSVLRLSGGGTGAVVRSDLAAGGFSDAIWLDLEGDGDLDIAAARPGSGAANGNLDFFVNNGLGTFVAVAGKLAGNGSIRLAAGDLDGDGDLDLIASNAGVANQRAAEIAVFLNAGNGSFTDATFDVQPFGSGVGLGEARLTDLDADGALDVVAVVNAPAGGGFPARSLVVVWPGRGDGTLEAPRELATGAGPYGVDVADFDGDGRPDLLTGDAGAPGGSGPNSGAAFSILFGDGQGEVRQRAQHLLHEAFTGAILAADMNGDGLPDVVATADDAVQVQLHRGELTAGPAKRFTYDDRFHQMTSRSNELGQTTLFALDPLNGNVTSETIVIGEPGGGDDLVTTFTYDARGLLLTRTDPLGRVTAHVYDAAGRKTSVVEAVGTPDEATTRFEYDAAGRVTAIVDPRGFRLEREYDAMNRVTRVLDPLGAVTETRYDAAGNPIEIVDAAGFSTTLAYDRLDRLTATQDPLGGIATRELDPIGNLVAEVDALGRRTRFEYDARDRLVRTIDPRGFDVENVYDDDDHLVRRVDQEGQATILQVDARGRVVATTDPLGGVVRTTFDAADQRTEEIDAAGRITAHRYDDAGRLVETRDAAGGVTGREYDAAGDLVRETDPLGRVTTFEFDARRRIVSTTDPAGRVMRTEYDASGNPITDIDALGRVTRREYDALNRLVAVTDALNGTSRTVFDARGHVVRIVDQLGRATNFEFDELGRRVQAIDPLGQVLETRYDAVGQVIERIDPLLRSTRMTFDASGNLLTETDPRGFTRRFTYDGRSAVTSTVDPEGAVSRVEYDAKGRVAREIDALGAAVSYVYDVTDDVSSFTDRLGRTTTFQYDTLRRLVASINPLGGVLATEYDAVGQVVRQVDELGRATLSEYDAVGRRVRVVDPLGRATQVEYDAADNVIATTDALGRVTQFTHDALDRRVEQTDALGRTTRFEYDAVANLTAEVDPRGNRTVHEYDALNRRVRTVDPVGGVVLREFDAASQLVRETDPAGRSTQYVYDGSGNRVRIVDPAGNAVVLAFDGRGLPVSSSDPLGRTTAYVYDPAGRRVQTVDPLGGVAQTTYDAKGNVVAATDAEGRRTEFTYDALDRRVELRDALGGVFREAYDASGQLIATTDERGGVTTFQYDAVGRTIRVVDPVGGVVVAEYDAVGNPLLRRDELGRETRFEYDALDRETTVVEPGGQIRRTTYDENGNVRTLVDAAGHVTTYEYDALDRLVATVDPLGGRTENTYDAVGQRTSERDALGQVTTYEYGPTGDRTRVVDPLGRATQFVYDAAHDEIRRIDAEGNTTQREYDALRRLTRSIDAAGGITRYAYDRVGDVTRITDPNGRQVTFEYDALRRLVRETDPSLGVRTMAYDAAGNLVTRIDRVGRRIEYVYDALNRPLEERWFAPGAATPLHVIASTFDAVGQLTATQEPGTRYEFTYDVSGDLIETSNAGTLGVPTVEFAAAYDERHLRESLQETIGGVPAALTERSHDALRRLTRVTQSGTGVDAKRVDLAYDALDGIVGVSRFADQSGLAPVAQTAVTVDAARRPLQIRHARQATTLRQFDHVFDAMNRLTSRQSSDGLTTFDYDPLGQLTLADYSFQADESFAYDPAGNRTSGGTSVDAANRLVTDADANYAYDADGNLIRIARKVGGEVVDFVWDHRHRMTSATVTVGGSVVRSAEYRYDPFNRRIERAVDLDGAGPGAEVVTRYVYDGDHVALTFDGQGTLTRRFLTGEVVDQVFAEESPGQTLWYLTDHLGTVIDLVDDTGALRNHLVYDAFGGIRSTTDAALQPMFTFTGREFDAETGLYYFRNRYYSPRLGRFVSEDPIRFQAGDLNLSRYVGNDPINLTDPFGLDADAGPTRPPLQFFRDQAFAHYARYQDISRNTLVGDDFALRAVEAELASAPRETQIFFRAATGALISDEESALIGGEKTRSGEEDPTSTRVRLEMDFARRMSNLEKEQAQSQRDLAKQLVKDNGLPYDKENVDAVAAALEKARLKAYDPLRRAELRQAELERNASIRNLLSGLSALSLLVPGGQIVSFVIDVGLLVEAGYRALNKCEDDDPSVLEVVLPMSALGINAGLKIVSHTTKAAQESARLLAETADEGRKLVNTQIDALNEIHKTTTKTTATLDEVVGGTQGALDDALRGTGAQTGRASSTVDNVLQTTQEIVTPAVRAGAELEPAVEQVAKEVVRSEGDDLARRVEGVFNPVDPELGEPLNFGRVLYNNQIFQAGVKSGFGVDEITEGVFAVTRPGGTRYLFNKFTGIRTFDDNLDELITAIKNRPRNQPPQPSSPPVTPPKIDTPLPKLDDVTLETKLPDLDFGE